MHITKKISIFSIYLMLISTPVYADNIALLFGNIDNSFLPENIIDSINNVSNTQSHNANPHTATFLKQTINEPSHQKNTIAQKTLNTTSQDNASSRLALEKVSNNEIELAYTILFDSLLINSPAHQSRKTLAQLFFKQGKFQDAQALIEEGLTLSPMSAEYIKLQARLFLQQEDFNQAIEILLKSPPLITNDPEYFELLGATLQQKNAHNEAIIVYKTLLNIDSTQSKWWVALGLSLESVGQQHNAMSSYQLALTGNQLDPKIRQYSESRITYLSQLL